jgi:prepilin-type N-terminal cleavage/methylation domain-containing protein
MQLTDKRGFSLIEILIAIAILAYGMMAVASMQISGMRANTRAARHTAQVKWAQDKLEALMALPYAHDDLKVSGNPHSETTSDGYTVTWNIADDDPVANTKRVTVTVTGHDVQTQVVSVKGA